MQSVLGHVIFDIGGNSYQQYTDTKKNKKLFDEIIYNYIINLVWSGYVSAYTACISSNCPIIGYVYFLFCVVVNFGEEETN